MTGELVFADTSALYALMAEDDLHHEKALAAWRRMDGANTRLLTTNHVLTECVSLLQRRLGMDTVVGFVSSVVPALEVEWLTKEHHAESMSMLLAARRRRLSLVDCTSILTMRQLGIQRAFHFGEHFDEHGFERV